MVQLQNTSSKRLDFVIKILEKKLDRQINSLTSLNTKITYMFAFLSLLLGGYLTIMFDNKIDFTCNLLLRLSNILGFLGLIISVWFLVFATRDRSFSDPPDPETIYSLAAFQTSLEDLKNQVASDMKDAFNHNTNQLIAISKWLNRSVISFMLTLLIIALTALFLPECAKIYL